MSVKFIPTKHKFDDSNLSRLTKIKYKNPLGNSPIFDAKMGGIGFIFMGSAVFLINFKYGINVALIAALKQGLYTFFVGGITIRLCENISTYYKNKVFSVSVSIAVSSILAIASTYFVHSLKGTPAPFESTIPTIIGAPLTYAYWAIRKLRQLEVIRGKLEA